MRTTAGNRADHRTDDWLRTLMAHSIAEKMDSSRRYDTGSGRGREDGLETDEGEDDGSVADRAAIDETGSVVEVGRRLVGVDGAAVDGRGSGGRLAADGRMSEAS